MPEPGTADGNVMAAAYLAALVVVVVAVVVTTMPVSVLRAPRRRPYRGALAAVHDLHHRRPHQLGDFVHFGQAVFPDLCDHCRVAYPCDTVQAIQEALDPRKANR
ncbi:hypothetical protein [Mumia sp. DW29H23]|uniref:hypothetical protein n=1 Tax=Mumia sp. DW29H23 TaxID=3421241 RepID=UPI003D693899